MKVNKLISDNGSAVYKDSRDHLLKFGTVFAWNNFVS